MTAGGYPGVPVAGVCGAVLVCILCIPEAAEIRGTVKNAQNGRCLGGVLVEIEGISRTVVSDSSGNFSFDSISPGSVNLLFYGKGMDPLRLNDVFIAGDAIKRCDVEMNPQIVSLDTLKVRSTAFRKPPDMASSTKIMNFDEILRSPGALVDVQRAVQNLPSVSSAGDNTNEIIVRGGNRGENLVIMDNIELPNPNHFADQGSGGGVVSLINPLLVRGLTFNAGAPPAKYGGKASSVLDVHLREGNGQMVLGGVDIGMAGAGLHVEGPLWKNATFMASATKSYLDLFARFAPSTAVPAYWGGQAKLTQKAGKHTLSGNCIYGANGIAIDDAVHDAGTDGDHIDAGGIIYATGLNWKAGWTGRLSSVVTVSGTGNSFDRLEYSDTTLEGTGVRDTFFVNESMEEEQVIKGTVSLDIGDKARLSAGLSGKRCDFDEKLSEQPFSGGEREVLETSLDGLAYKLGGYVSAILYPADRLKCVPGVRCDHFTYNKSTTVAPRLGCIYSLMPQLDLTASGGLQYQQPDYSDLASDRRNRDLPPRRVGTGIVGAEYALREAAARFVAEVFYKRYDNLPVPRERITEDPFDRSDVVLARGRGYSYGIELFTHKKLTSNFFGTAAYSLSRSWQYDPRPGHSGEKLRGDFDFRNMVTITAGYKIDLIKKKWYKRLHGHWWMVPLSPVFPLADRVELSTRWRYLGGRPYTEKTFDPLRQVWYDREENYLASEYKPYHRLDIRFERRYGFGFLQMIYYIDLQNVYNRQNIWTRMYSSRHEKVTPIYQFSFFPAGGVIIGF